MGEGAVLGLGSVATRDLEPWTVYAGVPAVKVKDSQTPRRGFPARMKKPHVPQRERGA